MMILTDLDHTLLRQDGSISENTLRVLERCKENGMTFAIATARYRIGAERYIDMLRPDYEITTDGTLIHSGDRCIYSCALTEDMTDMIVRELLGAVKDAEITVAVGKRVLWNSKNISASEKLYKAEYNDYSAPLGLGANKIVAELPDESIARSKADRAGCRMQSYRGENWYAFLPQGSGKVTAIRVLAKLSGTDIGDITAFGDDVNDIGMLQLCGSGIAVANAVPEVLDIADGITLSNDEDGVAHWLTEHFLKK